MFPKTKRTSAGRDNPCLFRIRKSACLHLKASAIRGAVSQAPCPVLPFFSFRLHLEPIPSGKRGNFTSGKEMTLQFLTKRYIPSPEPNTKPELHTMKVLSSLASMKRRHADCQIVKRKGTLYVICKSNPKFKARQGATAGTRLSKKGVK